MNITKRKRKTLIKSGAIHPFAVISERLKARAKDHPVWSGDYAYDLQSFPWPPGRTLWDLVAFEFQEVFGRMGLTEKHYFDLLGKVEIEVFGKTNPERVN